MEDMQRSKFPGFTLCTPTTWTINFDRKNPYSISVNIDATDSFQIDIGQRSKLSSNLQSIVVQDVILEEIVDEENAGKIVEETKTVKTTVFRSDDHSDMIANRVVTYKTPQMPGKGISGVFFETLNHSNESGLPMSFVAFNLKPENVIKFFAAIQTLTFNTNNDEEH